MTYKGIGEYRAITLTTVTGETIVGTSGDDTINAVEDTIANGGTFNIGDTVDGAAGTDTMNIAISAGAAKPAATTVKNVEIINLNVSDVAAAASYLTSGAYAGVEQLWQIDNNNATSQFGNVVVAAGVTAGFRSTGVASTSTTITGATVDGTSATQTSAAVALDGVGTTTLVFGGTTGAFQTVTVNGSIAHATNTLGITTDTVTKTVNVGLSSNTTVTVTEGAAGTTQTINLAESTGNVTLAAGAAAFTGLKSVTGGSGNDTLSVNFGTNANGLVVDTGAGNDTINVASTVAADVVIGDKGSITLGEGKDTVAVGAVGNISTSAAVTATTLVENLITITDFNTSEDVLNLGGNGIALTGAQLSTINGSASLLAAVTAVEAITGAAGDTIAAFSWGGDAYVFIDDGAGGLDGGDGLIKLTGVDATLFTDIQNGNLVL